jgi:adenylate kinase family enzyme
MVTPVSPLTGILRRVSLARMTRIVLLGPAGSGKTTFARRLGERTGLPVICLDDVWRPEWGKNDVPAFRSLLMAAHAGESWISDGNFAAATFDIRIPPATLIVWLDRPRWLCALRAMTRIFRPDSDHRIAGLIKVLRFIANFDRVNRPLIESLRLKHGPTVPVVHLKSDREIETFIRDCCPAATAST